MTSLDWAAISLCFSFFSLGVSLTLYLLNNREDNEETTLKKKPKLKKGDLAWLSLT